MLVPVLLLLVLVGLGLALASSPEEESPQSAVRDRRFWAGVLVGAAGLLLVAGLSMAAGMALTDMGEMGEMGGSGPAGDGHGDHDHARADPSRLAAQGSADTASQPAHASTFQATTATWTQDAGDTS